MLMNVFDFVPEAPTSSDVLQLDVDGKLGLTVQSFIGQRTAILGSSGGGKTNTLALILEKVLPFMPTVIFDQHDEYWGLCEQFEILRVGKSEMSQIKAGPEQAIQIAEISHSKRMSVLVEMLDMSRAERQDFVELYCTHIWELNKRSKLPYGIVLEEAQNFIPEGRTTPAQELMKQFALEGRKFGFSIFISTQRSAEVSKTILAQCGLAFLHGVDIYPDVQAYAGMLPFTAAETKKIALNLAVGQCIVKIKHDGPAKFLHPVKMLRRETFHVGDTPTLDEEAPPLRAVDSELLQELQALLTPPPFPSVTLPASDEGEQYKVAHDAHVDSFIKDLRRQLEEAQDAIERMKRQPVAVRQELPAVDMTQHIAAPEPYSQWDGRTELATTRSRNRQTNQFAALLSDIRRAEKMHRLILVYLTQRENLEIGERDLARNTAYSRSSLESHRPVAFERQGLIKRVMRGGIYVYQSTARRFIKANYPDLDEDALVEQICKLEKV